MFPEKERQIFAYSPDGTKKVILADPAALDRRMNHYLKAETVEVLRNWNMASDEKNPQPSLMPNPDAIFEAQNDLVEAVRQAFKMTPWDDDTGTGAGEEDCMKVWTDFVEFMEQKKSSDESLPTPSNSGAGLTSPPSLEYPGQITTPTLPSV